MAQEQTLCGSPSKNSVQLLKLALTFVLCQQFVR